MEIKEYHHKFLEHTILSIFLWAGVWGTLSLFMDHYVQTFGLKFMIYITLVIISFSLLVCRDHIKSS